jgi:hypothetical protein
MKYLEQAKEELRKEEEARVLARLVERRKAIANRQLLETQLNKKAEDEREAELYLKQAQDEAQAKQEEAWRIDAEKRRRLQIETTKGQLMQMQERDLALKAKIREKIEERMRCEAEREAKRQSDQEELEQRLRMIRNQQEMLDRQVALRREKELRRKKEEQEAVQKLLRGWAEEEQKIKEALQHPEDFVGKKWRGFR